MNRIAVVHLVRAQNGLGEFASFLESYVANHGGLDHDLVLVFKGFADRATPRDYLSLLSGVEYRDLHVTDDGFDLTAYRKAMRALRDFDYYCFLNSFSRPIDHDWLAKLHNQAARQGVGISGATGSYQSMSPALSLGISQSVKKLLSGQELARGQWHNRAKRAVNMPDAVLKHAQSRLSFKPFPNHHIRTNGFMLSRRSLEAVRWPRVRSKRDAYLLESGRRSLTQQLLRQGLRAVVVGRDGVGYDTDQWISSNTFWQADQGNLLIDDNQTRQYRDGDEQTRSRLSLYAWEQDLTRGPVDPTAAGA
jgi:hypothetical protein